MPFYSTPLFFGIVLCEQKVKKNNKSASSENSYTKQNTDSLNKQMCIRELSYHGLQIYLRVPIWIIKNNHISSCQINSKTSSSGTQHENEFTAVRSIKCVNCLLKEKKKVSLKYQIFQTSFQYVGGFPNKFILNLHHFHIKKILSK